MSVADLTDWLADRSGETSVWYVKRLSGNDTLANGSHQAGPYIPKEFLFTVFPDLNRPEALNPDVWFDLHIDSRPDHRRARVIWYNNRLHGGTRNETRLTNLGGGASALLDPDSTGALTVFAFSPGAVAGSSDCRVWVCRNEAEEELVEDRTGPVEPGRWAVWSPAQARPGALPVPASRTRVSCWLTPAEVPPAWLTRFPTGAEIIGKAVELRPDRALPPDRRLMQRRDCEFELFRSVEEAVELPVIRAGFVSVDEFITRAQTILQRRKARSGRSLELHARAIFLEERLRENTEFVHQPESEPGRQPDFLFPSVQAYRDPAFPGERLRMLAVKTTCKDRWRQILNEADRVPRKHLLTLQEGISENQFREMTAAGVQLVVPAPLIGKYPKPVQPHLKTLGEFIADVKTLRVS